MPQPDPLLIGGRYRNAAVEDFFPGDKLPCEVKDGEAVEAYHVVELTDGYEVQHAGANSTAFLGVSLFDVPADLSERELSVACVGVWKLKVSGGGNAGDIVICAADGEVVVDNTPTSGLQVGKLMADVANNAYGPVKLG